MLPREKHANFQSQYVVELCLELMLVGGWFSIENPWSSDFWRSRPFRRLRDSSSVSLVHVAQCAYGHKLPGCCKHHFCHKATGFASNLPHISLIESRCPGVGPRHQHDRAWGSRKFQGKTISLASSAAAYPPKLCQALAQVVKAQLGSDCAGRDGVPDC